MNKTIKKIVAFGTGALMLGATAAMATALDLSNYPEPFVKNGAFDGRIVIGSAAKTIDVVGALDIATSLQRQATTKVASTEGSTSVSGGIRLDTSGDRIYLGGSTTVDSVSNTDMDILADGSFEDDEGTVFDYTQAIDFSTDPVLEFSNHGESDVDSFLAFDPLPTSVDTSNYFYVTKVDFTKAINTSDTNVVGNKIVLFGTEYTFSADSDESKIVLYGSSKEVSLTTKDEVTQMVDNKEYKVKVIGFSEGNTPKVVVSVNGQADSVAEDASKTINGLKVYAKSVSSWNNGADGFAVLQLGAQKVTLEDGQAVTMGTSDTDVDGTYVSFEGGTADDLSSLYIYVGAPDSDSDYLKEGGSFTDPVYGTFKFMYTDNKYGLADATRDMITLKASGTHKAQVKLPSGSSDKTITIAYDDELAWDSTTNGDRYIWTSEGAPALEDDYLYLTPGDPKYTHLAKVTKIHKNADTGYVEFEDVLTGATYKTKEGAFNADSDALDMTVDGKTYTVTLDTAATPDITVTYGAANVVFPSIELKNGEEFALLNNATGLSFASASAILLPTGTLTYSNLTMATGSTQTVGGVGYKIHRSGNTLVAIEGSATPGILIREEEDDVNTRNTVIATTTYNGGTGIDISPTVSFSDGAASLAQDMADDDTTANLDLFGTYATVYNPSTDNGNVVKIWYPQDQLYANLFISPLAAKTVKPDVTGAVTLNAIPVGMAILDTEASLGSRPYIVVGGPCVNTVAQTLMGNPAQCWTGFTEGKAMIKLFADKNALLVAGYGGTDTQGACRVLATYKDFGFAGTELEVITATLTDLKVNKVQ